MESACLAGSLESYLEQAVMWLQEEDLGDNQLSPSFPRGVTEMENECG